MRLFSINREEGRPVTERRERLQFDSESEMEALVHANPGLLLDEPVFVFSRQPRLDPGLPDLVALDQYGNVVVFELKKGLSGTGSASEESIISQPQQYARALAPFDYAELNKLYQEYRQQVLSGEWSVSDEAVPADSLDDAFEVVYGQSIRQGWFNQQQRLVVVAETITKQTAKNARYLQEQGLNIQCHEVQMYGESEQERPLVATNTVVDYDLRAVRPDRYGKPTYEDINRRIIAQTLDHVGELVQARSPDAIVDDLSRRQPALRSNNPDHPDGVEYSLRVKPVENSTVQVTIDVKNGDDLVAAIRAAEPAFRDAEFDVSHSRSINRIVQYQWDIDEVEPLHQEEVQEQIALQFAELIRTGHEVFDAT